MDIHILQGERTMAKDNVDLGSLSLQDIPPARKGVPQIEVTFDIDSNGILHVMAKDKDRKGAEHGHNSAEQDEQGGDRAKMAKDAKQYEEEDKKLREQIETEERGRIHGLYSRRHLEGLQGQDTEGCHTTR